MGIAHHGLEFTRRQALVSSVMITGAALLSGRIGSASADTLTSPAAFTPQRRGTYMAVVRAIASPANQVRANQASSAASLFGSVFDASPPSVKSVYAAALDEIEGGPAGGTYSQQDATAASQMLQRWIAGGNQGPFGPAVGEPTSLRGYVGSRQGTAPSRLSAGCDEEADGPCPPGNFKSGSTSPITPVVVDKATYRAYAAALVIEVAAAPFYPVWGDQGHIQVSI